MRKLGTHSFLCVSLLLLTSLLGACGTAKTPSQNGPELLVLLGDQTRTVTGTSVVIVGAVGDAASLKSLGYTLNGARCKTRWAA